MSDYETSWRKWAAAQYPDLAAANVAAEAAIAAARAMTPVESIRVAAHRAAVDAGAEYRCRPDRAGMAIALCVLLFAIFVPATLSGLSINPAVGGYLFLAGSILLPVLGVVGLVMVRKNSCFFVNREMVGRRSWRGSQVAAVPRAGLRSVNLRAGSWAKTVLGDEPDEATVEIVGDHASIPTTDLYWWSNARIRELAQVARP